MKSKKLSENILKTVKSRGYKYIELDAVIDADQIIQRSGENFRKFILPENTGSHLNIYIHTFPI